MSKYPTAIIPYSKMSPAACAALVAALDDALEIFVKWKFTDQITSKLQKAQKQLTKVSKNNSYGDSAQELRKTARAIQFAHDFYLISRTLTGERADTIALELENALRGSLEEVETDKKSAFDFQSQFWFGTILAHSNLHPSVPNITGKKPDFLIKVGSFESGVEIKRPKLITSIKGAISTAAKQLNDYGQPGVISIDLSRALEVDKYVVYSGNQTPREILEGRFFPLSKDLCTYIEAYKRSEKFSRIILLITYARFFNWTIGKQVDADIGFFSNSQVFSDACAGLVLDKSRRIEQLIENGFSRLSTYRSAKRVRT